MSKRRLFSWSVHFSVQYVRPHFTDHRHFCFHMKLKNTWTLSLNERQANCNSFSRLNQFTSLNCGDFVFNRILLGALTTAEKKANSSFVPAGIRIFEY